MQKNTLLTSWRNFRKNILHNLLNLTGLILGIASTLVIGLWVNDEMSFNSNFSNHKSLARVLSTTTFNGETATGGGIAAPTADKMRIDYAADYNHISLVSEDLTYVLHSSTKSLESTGIWVESEFSNMFSLQMNEGKENSLSDPSAIFISQSLATKIFGKKEAVNQAIRVNNNFDMKVAGVFKDFPDNCSFSNIQFLLSWKNKQHPGLESGWISHHCSMYVQLNHPADLERVSKKIENISAPFLKGVFIEKFRLQRASAGDVDHQWPV